MANPASTWQQLGCAISLDRHCSTKRYMNMRPLFQLQIGKTKAVA
jgi:hypothetical protein